MGFAAGMLAGTNLAKTVRKNMRDSADDAMSADLACATAAAESKDPDALAKCKAKGKGIPDGEEGKQDLDDYAMSTPDWGAYNDDGITTRAPGDDVEMLKGASMRGSFGETGIPDDPRLRQGVAAAEGGAIDAGGGMNSPQALPEQDQPIQQGVGGEPITPAGADINEMPPVEADETVSADVPRDPSIDNMVRLQQVDQERTNKPWTAKHQNEAQSMIIRSMKLKTPEDVAKVTQMVRSRRQQAAVGYMAASEAAYKAGNLELAERNARLSFGFLPTGSSLQFAPIQGKMAGASIDEYSGQRKSDPFVISDEFYTSSYAIMKDPAQWGLWSAKGDREVETHAAAMALSKAQTTKYTAATLDHLWGTVAKRGAKGSSSGGAGGTKGFSDPAKSYEDFENTMQPQLDELKDNKLYNIHDRVLDDEANLFDDEQSKAQWEYHAIGLRQNNPGRHPKEVGLMAADVVWWTEASQEERDASGMIVKPTENSASASGWSVLASRAVVDKDGNPVLGADGKATFTNPIVMDATPEVAQALGAKGDVKSGAMDAERMSLFKMLLKYNNGGSVEVFGPISSAQLADVVDGKAKVSTDGALPDKNSQAYAVKEIVEKSKEEADVAVRKAKTQSATHRAKTNSGTFSTDNEYDTGQGPAGLPLKKQKPEVTPIPDAASKAPSWHTPGLERDASTPRALDIDDQVHAETPPGGVITTPANEGPASIATGIPTIDPGVDNQPGVPDVRNPAASILPPDADKAAWIADANLTQDGMDLVNTLGIDPGIHAAVNGGPAPEAKKLTPEEGREAMAALTAATQARMGEPGSPERDAVVEDYVQRFAKAETGSLKNPYIRTQYAPLEGSTAYGPLQMTDTLLAEAQKPANKGMFTPAEAKFIDRMRAQNVLFKKNGYNPAYMEANPGTPDPRQQPDYDADYDYGGKGMELTPEDKELYMSVSRKLVGKLVEKYNGDVDKVTTAWRYGANSKKSAADGDPKYLQKFLAGSING